ncbi:MAG: hypothetical protein E6Z93_05090 [Veillonella sp.]|uniref:hypothetical protein n=1 Tax=Veillonella sp. TaxID=1926307 RepID=UPI002907CC19|nr:hypothetical protein [Veillonella sp.]MDU5732775.1 hypothetical protein [Veillonella sp.]
MSKEKRRVPKLRFPGFTEDWEQRKLGAMCSLFIDGDWIESKDQSNEGIRLIQVNLLINQRIKNGFHIAHLII